MGATQVRAESCSLAQDHLASLRLEKATGLTEIRAVANEFPGCMQGGGISEEVSDGVAVQLSRHWVRSISALTTQQRDAKLLTFVLTHLNATDSSDDLKKVERNARLSCPKGARPICHQIREAAAAALKESNP
jgi:hypothetical protein